MQNILSPNYHLQKYIGLLFGYVIKLAICYILIKVSVHYKIVINKYTAPVTSTWPMLSHWWSFTDRNKLMRLFDEPFHLTQRRKSTRLQLGPNWVP